ncbi:MAG TPA: helix-turn-helix domain-containing protein [Actinopolymorphaceae bacterium]|nr:helix-turn-helix domain-containing protein [Actinopolymorphaceae bacterium]
MDARASGEGNTDGAESTNLPVMPGFRQMALRRRKLAAELVELRRRSGLSQTQVAARMGTSQSAVARLEGGDVDVRMSTLERYAAAVGHRVDVHLDADPTGRGASTSTNRGSRTGSSQGPDGTQRTSRPGRYG